MNYHEGTISTSREWRYYNPPRRYWWDNPRTTRIHLDHPRRKASHTPRHEKNGTPDAGAHMIWIIPALFTLCLAIMAYGIRRELKR